MTTISLNPFENRVTFELKRWPNYAENSSKSLREQGYV